MEIIVIYYVVVNVAAFAMYGADKYFAKNGMWRVPEKSLLGVAAIGGAFGAFGGMEFFRHKTKHNNFKILVPVFCAAHLAFLAYCFAK